MTAARRTARALTPVAPTSPVQGGTWTRGRAFVVPPSELAAVAEPVSVKTAGAQGAVLALSLSTIEDDGEDRRVIAVYSEPQSDDELDLAGAVELREQLAALLPRLDSMITALADDARHR